MRRLLLGLVLSCAPQPQGPWRGALGVLEAFKYEGEVLKGALSWARADTLGLTAAEKDEFLKALQLAPEDREGAARTLLRLAYKRGFGPEAQGALGLSLPPETVRALLEGREVRIFPEEPSPPEGIVAEGWPDGYLQPFLELSRWGFMLPVSVPEGTLYALVDTGYVPLEVEDTLFKPREGLSQEESFLVLPVPLKVFNLEAAISRLDGLEWCFGFDSIRVFRREGPFAYGRGWKGREVYSVVMVCDSLVPSWVRAYPPGSDVLSVGCLGAVDLDGDGQPELVLAEEGEISRRWEVLKKMGPSWLSVYSYSLEEEVD